MSRTYDLHLLPPAMRRELRGKVIRTFYRKGYTMDDICAISRKRPALFYTSSGLSKTTVFFAVNGRAKKGVQKMSRKTK